MTITRLMRWLRLLTLFQIVHRLVQSLERIEIATEVVITTSTEKKVTGNGKNEIDAIAAW
ncbi:MAG TPA: hypothetical protein PLI53_04475 [Geobacteraceae bacterium]|nr:hypothetical protein [Geobacteraceae bacterium]